MQRRDERRVPRRLWRARQQFISALSTCWPQQTAPSGHDGSAPSASADDRTKIAAAPAGWCSHIASLRSVSPHFMAFAILLTRYDPQLAARRSPAQPLIQFAAHRHDRLNTSAAADRRRAPVQRPLLRCGRQDGAVACARPGLNRFRKAASPPDGPCMQFEEAAPRGARWWHQNTRRESAAIFL